MGDKSSTIIVKAPKRRNLLAVAARNRRVEPFKDRRAEREGAKSWSRFLKDAD